jgi:hypothetical protein
MNWTNLSHCLVGLGEEGVSPEQKLSVYQRVKANLLPVPEIAEHTDVAVSAKQIKVSWKNGRQIARINRYEHAEPLAEFLIAEIPKNWAR